MARSIPLLSPPIYLCLLLAAVSAGAQCANEVCPTVTSFPNDTPPNNGPPSNAGTIIGVILGLFGFILIVALIVRCTQPSRNQNLQLPTYVQNARPATQVNPAALNPPPYSLELPATTHHHMHHHGHNDVVNQMNLQNQFAMQNQMSTTMAANTMAVNPGM
ncbi:hypothetical protein B0H11DRAFT_1999109 [Mycena galericulata]|nr:hypothetical protein B0H11DRAFT_1999109 [Mycena galericulata]